MSDKIKQRRRSVLKAFGTTGAVTGSALIAGCLGDEGNETDPDDSEQKTFTVAVGSEGTISYTIGGHMTSLLSDVESRVQIQNESTSGVEENIRLVGRGDLPFGHGSHELLHSAFEGINLAGEFGERPVKHQMLQVLPHSEVNITYGTYADRDIPNLARENVEGKTLSLGAAGATATWRTPLWVAFDEVGPEEFMETETTDYVDIPPRVRSGQIDVYPAFYASRLSLASGLQELVNDEDVRIAQFTDEQVERLDDSFYYVVELDPDELWEVDVGVDTLHAATMGYQIVSAEHTSEDVVYEFVKSLGDNAEQLREAWGGLQLFSPEHAVDALMDQPVHPGAARYYQEAGVWDDSLPIGEVSDPVHTF